MSLKFNYSTHHGEVTEKKVTQKFRYKQDELRKKSLSLPLRNQISASNE